MNKVFCLSSSDSGTAFFELSRCKQLLVIAANKLSGYLTTIAVDYKSVLKTGTDSTLCREGARIGDMTLLAFQQVLILGREDFVELLGSENITRLHDANALNEGIPRVTALLAALGW
eukprot:TRINITY_DN7679_c0_g1_i1.p1 TRINITY_DN7679_c0_g1~~TRINITY_DN7679_c0_g1_i1.p1  ORF type:complete len:117 (-),score=25.21 TRINITY_DN7679_c0_g1_i1:160-510(-)